MIYLFVNPFTELHLGECVIQPGTCVTYCLAALALLRPLPLRPLRPLGPLPSSSLPLPSLPSLPSRHPLPSLASLPGAFLGIEGMHHLCCSRLGPKLGSVVSRGEFGSREYNTMRLAAIDGVHNMHASRVQTNRTLASHSSSCRMRPCTKPRAPCLD